MFNLPESTRIKKNIFKKLIYNRFQNELSGKKKQIFDQDISKITIINEISQQSINIDSTEEVNAIFVVKIELRRMNYNNQSLELITQLFGQHLLLAIQYNDKYRLAIYESKLLMSDWKNQEDINLTLSGLNLQKVWENLVTQVANIQIEKGNTLLEQIEIESQRQNLIKLIDSTERKARREAQAKKKFKLFKKAQQYKKELERL